MQPSETDRRVDNLIALTSQLSDLLDTEQAMLRTNRPSEIQDLNDQKSKLSALYQREMTALKADPSKIKELSKERREALKESTAAFRKNTDQHLQLLQSFRHISEGIVKSVAEEAVAKETPAAGYGRTAMAPKPSAGTPRAFAVNQVI